MRLDRNGTLPDSRALEASFTGDVRIGNYFEREAPSRLAGAIVTFSPGSRTPRKINPLGQTLIVTSGVGWAKGEGEEIVEIRTGDMIAWAPGERHWEGATPDHSMTYIAIHEVQDGRAVVFGAKVTDEDYRRGPPVA